MKYSFYIIYSEESKEWMIPILKKYLDTETFVLSFWNDDIDLKIIKNLNFTLLKKTDYIQYGECDSELFFNNISEFFTRKTSESYKGLVFFDINFKNVYISHYGNEITLDNPTESQLKYFEDILKEYDIEYSLDKYI